MLFLNMNWKFKIALLHIKRCEVSLQNIVDVRVIHLISEFVCLASLLCKRVHGFFVFPDCFKESDKFFGIIVMGMIMREK